MRSRIQHKTFYNLQARNHKGCCGILQRVQPQLRACMLRGNATIYLTQRVQVPK